MGAVCAVLATVAVSASPAAATYEDVTSGEFPATENSLSEDEAQCNGSGDIAISGGVYNGAPINEMLWLNSSRPGALDNVAEAGSWTGRYHNVFDGISTAPPAEVRAVCDIDGAGDYRVRMTTNVKLKPIRQVKFLQRCRDDEAVVGGGLELNIAASHAFPTTSTPRDDRDRDKLPDGWQVVVDTQSLDTDQARMDVYAVCDKTRKPKRYRYKTANIQVADGAQDGVAAACPVLPEFEPRVGGGLAASTRLKHRLRINSSYPESGGGGAWGAFVDNVDTVDNESRKITATAICLR